MVAVSIKSPCTKAVIAYPLSPLPASNLKTQEPHPNLRPSTLLFSHPPSHRTSVASYDAAAVRMHTVALFTTLLLLALSAVGSAEDLVRFDRIKVFLFATPAFWGEVAIDAYKNACINLDNNLIDGRVQSILVGAHDVPSVLRRDDDWYCTFYDNYECSGDEERMLIFSGGVNNLRSVGWETKVHALKCRIENDD